MLKQWADGLEGFSSPPDELHCETSWSANLVLVDGSGGGEARPHEGTAVYVYERLA